jgi:tRNA (guanine-N7-)-methyltransferase
MSDTTDDDTDAHQAFELRSFGRRRGRKPSARQQKLLTERLPRVRFDPTAPLPTTGRPLWLEIGFGGGEHLLWQARANPGVHLIGCEPFEEGVVKVLSAIETEHLENITLHADDARDVLRALPPASVDRAFVLFPDPWPKKKHRKRRLVNVAFLTALARVLKPGAELRLATDIADYARTMLMAARQVPDLVWQAAGPDDWRLRPSDGPETRYEAKARRAGRRSAYLRLHKTLAPAAAAPPPHSWPSALS